MKWISDRTKICWDMIHRCLVNNGRYKLTYSKPFDEEIANFLLPDNYKRFTLSVMVDSVESGTALIGFINDVSDFHELRFDQVQWDLEEDSPKYLTQVYKRLVMLGLPDRIFINNHSRLVYEYLRYDTLKGYVIPYVDYMENIGEHIYTEKVGSLEVSTTNIDKDLLRSLN